MIKGFSLMEMVVSLTIIVGILSVLIANVGESAQVHKKVISNQQKMEAIFHTVDMIRSDLTKCGMRLQEASRFFSFPLFDFTDYSFKVVYGLQSENLLAEAPAGTNIILANKNEYFQKKKKIIIYDPYREYYETNEIASVKGNQLTLLQTLKNPYSNQAVAVVVKEVEYKLYPAQNTLKRKINQGYFQPIIEEVTDFNITFYPDVFSVLYRIEVNHKQQIRGYIFLSQLGNY